MSRADVRVFPVVLDQPASVVARLDVFLDGDEFAASTRIRVARAVTRIVLGAALGVDPARVRISRRCARCGHPTHGRPAVVDNDQISFSLSHSGACALIAVSEGGDRVGIDVEVVRARRRLDALAARVLADDEYAAWSVIDDPDERLRSFLRAWTAKEAYLKALGIGIATRLRDVPGRVDGWCIRELPVGRHRVAALAVDRADCAVQRGDLSPFLAEYRDFVLEDDEDYAAPDGDPDGDPDPAELEVGEPEAVVGHAAPAPIERFRRTSVGTVFAAGLFGLRDVLEPPKDETPAIVEDWAGAEPFKDPIVLRLDPDHPEDSIVMIRPWLNDKKPKS